MSTHKLEYVEGSGNIYEDIGFPDAEERLVKQNWPCVLKILLKKEN